MTDWTNYTNAELISAFLFYGLEKNPSTKQLREEIAEEVGLRGQNVYELEENKEEREKFCNE